MKLREIIDFVRPNGAEAEDGTYSGAHLGLRVLAIIAACFAVYSNALPGDFVYDDVHQVVENRWLRDMAHVPEVFSSGVWGFSGGEQSNYYRPFMHLSYMVTYALFGLRPWAFHLVNILFHAGVSVLVFFVGIKLHAAARSAPSFRVPFLAALLFATHPIHTEAVTWIAGFPEVSFSFLFLLSFYFYMWATAGDREPRASLYLSSLLCFFLATFCKETALTLPIVLAIYDLSFRKGPLRLLSLLKRYLPYLLVAVVYLAIRTSVLGGFASMERYAELSGYEYFINVFPLVSRYLGKLLLPTDLNAFYGFHPIHSLLQWQGIASLAVTCGFLFLLWASYRRDRLAFFSASFIVIPLLPVLYIPALGSNTFTERYLYLPSFGYVLLVSAFLAWLAKKQPRMGTALTAGALIVLAAYSVGTLRRNPIWGDDVRLWADTVAKSPDSVLPHSELGIAYAARGERSKAIEQYRITLRMNPNFADGYSNLGALYGDMGMFDEAIRQHREALRLKPTSPAAHNNIGLAFSRKGMLAEAVEHYRESLRLEPLSPGVHNNLGNAYQSMGMLDEAIAEYREALRIQRDFPDTYINLGVAYAKKGMLDEAMAQFLSAEALNPDNPVVQHNLANAYALKGLPDKAEEHRRKAASLEAASNR